MNSHVGKKICVRNRAIATCKFIATALIIVMLDMSINHSIAWAQSPGSTSTSWPNRPIRVVIPFAAGGATDSVARALSPKLSEILGQTLVLDNRVGAGGAIATEITAKAAPDGYTLMFTSGPPHNTFPFFFKNLSFDVLKDFTPIMVVGTAPQGIAVSASLPVNSLQELIEYGRKNPGKLAYGTAGNGSVQHLAGVMLNRAAKIDMVHVPYKGGSPALNDLLGGQIPVGIFILSTVMPHAKSGKVKLLAVLDSQRARTAPDTPTVVESGLSNFFVPETWIGLVGPANLPQSIVNQLQAALTKAIAVPEVRARLESAGFEVKTGTPEEFSELMNKSVEVYRRITTEAGIKPE